MKTLDERLDVAERAIRALDMLVKFDGCKNSDVADAIAEARAKLKRLPVTKDGKHVVPGIDHVYHPDSEWCGKVSYQADEWWADFDGIRGHLVYDCYSTREAAKGAK